MRKTHPAVILVFTSMVLAVLSCGTKIEKAAPSIVINLPASGSSLRLGEMIEIVSTASGEAGIANVELSIDGQVVNIASPPRGHPTTFAAVQFWRPESEGQFRITVIAEDVDAKVSEPASIELLVIAEVEATITPTVAPKTPLPSPPHTPATATPLPCTLDATLLEDITIPDRNVMLPGETFTKIWRIQNSGTCAWPQGTELAYSRGVYFPGPYFIPVPAADVDEVVEINFEITMPEFPEVYVGSFSWLWHLSAEGYGYFGPNFIVTVSYEIRMTPTITPFMTQTKHPDEPTPTVPPYITPTYTPHADVQIQRLDNQTSVAPGELGYVEASCPEGSVVLSGGFSTDPDVFIYTHSKSGNGWQGYGMNNAETEKLLRVYATCYFSTTASSTQVYSQVAVASGSIGQGTSACPAGSIVTGGGWAANADSALYIYNSSKSGNGWKINVKNNGDDETFFNAYAICLSGVNATTIQRGVNLSITAGSTGAAKAVCEEGELVAGGGFASNEDLHIYDSSPEKGSDSTWWAYAVNPTGATQLLGSYAICMSSP